MQKQQWIANDILIISEIFGLFDVAVLSLHALYCTIDTFQLDFRNCVSSYWSLHNDFWAVPSRAYWTGISVVSKNWLSSAGTGVEPTDLEDMSCVITPTYMKRSKDSPA